MGPNLAYMLLLITLCLTVFGVLNNAKDALGCYRQGAREAKNSCRF